MKHKHYDMIVAWAEGKPIQVKFDRFDKEWSDFTDGFIPSWNQECEYRIKPEPKPDIEYIGHVQIANTSQAGKLLPGMVRIIYDSETGKPKSVELVK